MSNSGPRAGERQGAESLAQRVAREIGTAIVRGDYRSGETLPVESEICRALDVGRNILREAVKTLAGKGLLRTGRRAGTMVLPKSQWNLLDPEVLGWTVASDALRGDLLRELTQLRTMIEPNVAALAATNATITETLRLFEAYEAMERFRRDPDLAIEADIHFHERLFEASHNQLAGSLLRAFVVVLRANFEITIHSAGGFIRNLEEHRTVAEAVHRRDPEAARRAMVQLLANNEADLAQMMAGPAGDAAAGDRLATVHGEEGGR